VSRTELALLLLLAVAGPPSRASADEPSAQQRLDEVQRNLETSRREGETLSRTAAALKAEIAKLQAQAVEAAKTAQENEREVAAAEQALGRLQLDEQDQRRALELRRVREGELLAALERLAAVPPSAMAFAPGSPVDLARGGMLMGAAVPRLEAEARDLAQAVAQLGRMEVAIAGRKADLAQRQAVLDAARNTLAGTVARRRALEGETEEKARAAQQRIEALVAQASDLRQAVERIERERQERATEEARHAAEQAAVARTPVPTGPGPRLAVPVVGELVKRFGDQEEYGKAKGLSFGTRPGAQVVAAFDGEIMFAGPFQGYGQILIIDHGGGYHLLMAGIGRIQGGVGQKVVTGEPVGTMASEGTPTLYFELRREGQPVDPLPWLAAHDAKVSG
jgi:septal ring factor EnvC (AmiA/AmiB activator)